MTTSSSTQVSDFTPSTARTGLTAKIALLSGSTLVALLLGELLLRISGWAGMVVFTPHTEYGFRLTPNQSTEVYGHPVQINSLGFRGPEIDPVKSADRRRVVFIGDSVTYGGGRIREEELFCRVVAERARADGSSVETLNLSAPAWAPRNWIEYVEQSGLHDADVVVLILPECDLARPFMTMGLAGHRETSLPLRVGNLFLKARAIVQDRLDSPEITSQQSARRRTSIASTNAEAIDRLREIVGETPFLPVLVPSDNSSFKRFWPIFEPRLSDALDLRDELSPEHFLDGAHLNVEGHRIVADAIYSKISGSLRGSEVIARGPE